jgi:tetratricopeptide (TPR) repeat protein
MKKLINLVLFTIITVTSIGQQSFDYMIKARALKKEGQTDKAINLLTEAIAVIKDTRLYIERADVKILKSDYSGAISDLNEANRLTPVSGEYGLSKVYALKGDAATSLYHLEMNLNSSFKKSEKEILLDPSFRKIENRSEWRQFWKKEWYSATDEGISEIEYYLSAGKTDESLTILSDLKKNYENTSDVLYATALIDLNLNKYDDASKIASELLVTDPENEKYLFILAKAQSANSNPAGASDTYSQLMSIGVPDAELLILRAECYVKTGETGKALTDVEKYLDIYPENKEALSLAGKVVARSGDNIKALQYFSENLKKHPDDPECFMDRANSYFVSRSWNLAINDYSMSLDLKPENSDIWLNKGIALLNLGKKEDACHDFRKSFDMGNKRASDYISRNCIK